MTSNIRFEVFLHPDAEKEIKKLPENFKALVMEKINTLDFCMRMGTPENFSVEHVRKFQVRGINFSACDTGSSLFSGEVLTNKIVLYFFHGYHPFSCNIMSNFLSNGDTDHPVLL